jgi:hypothetical protein
MPQIEFSVININAAFFNESGKAEKPLELALQFYNVGTNAWQVFSTAFSTEKGLLSKPVKPTAKTAGFAPLKEIASTGSTPPFRLAIAASLKTGMTLVVAEAPAVQFDSKAKALTLNFGKNFAQPEAIVKAYLLDEATATTKIYAPLPAATQTGGDETAQLKKELAASIKYADTLLKASTKLESDSKKLQAEFEKATARIQETTVLTEAAAAEATAIKKEMAVRDKAIAKMENEKVKTEALVQKRMGEMEGKLAESMQTMTQLDKVLIEKTELIRAAEVAAAAQIVEYELLQRQVLSLDVTIQQNVEAIRTLNNQLKVTSGEVEAKNKIITQQAADYQKLEMKLIQLSQEAVEYKPVAQPVSRVYSSILDEFKKTTELTKDSNYKLANISLNIKTFMEFDEGGMRMQLVDANKLSGLPAEALSDFRVEIGESSAATSGTAKVPDLLGLTETGARKVLSSLGLNLKPVYQQNKSVPDGQSFKQSPAAGNVLPGSDVTIVFSKL